MTRFQAYRREAFLDADAPGRRELAAELATTITNAVRSEIGHSAPQAGGAETDQPDWQRHVESIVSDLQSLGHELVLHKRAPGTERWGPQFAHPTIAGILVEFTSDGEAVVDWLG